jgi:hypothetical protein
MIRDPELCTTDGSILEMNKDGRNSNGKGSDLDADSEDTRRKVILPKSPSGVEQRACCDDTTKAKE